MLDAVELLLVAWDASHAGRSSKKNEQVTGEVDAGFMLITPFKSINESKDIFRGISPSKYSPKPVYFIPVSNHFRKSTSFIFLLARILILELLVNTLYRALINQIIRTDMRSYQYLD